jgi:steroid delta-isomerase-like uncharacterized protein
MATQDKNLQGQKGAVPRGNGHAILSNEEIARTFHRLFNERKWDEMLALVSDDCTWELTPFSQTYKGKQGYRQICQMWLDGIPDGKCDVQNVVTTNDRIVVEFIGRGTHSGTLKGPAGTVAPTNKRVNLPYCDVMEVRNGQIVSARSYFDMNTLLSQVGVQPSSVKH